MQGIGQKRTALAGFLLAALFSFAYVFCIGLTNDTNTLLHYALIFLTQGGLYTHWLQFNAPLAIMLYVPPAALIHTLHIPPAVALHGYIVVLVIISLVLVTFSLDKKIRLFWLAACAVTLLVAPSFSYVFGDREQLLFIFALPWMLHMLLGIQPKAITTVFACIGFFLKPYNLIFFIILQLVAGPQQPLSKKIWGTNARIVAAMGLLYAFTVYLFFYSYIITLVPLMMTTYPYLYMPFSHKFTNGICLIAIALMLVFECVPDAHTRRAWYGFLAAATLAYCLNAGWSYTLYLLFAPMTLLCFYLWHTALNRESHRISVRITKDIILFVAALLLSLGLIDTGEDIVYTRKDGFARNYNHLPTDFYRQLRSQAGDEFILLSTTLWGTNVSVLDSTPHTVFAYDSLWPLPWLLSHLDDPRAANIAKDINGPLAYALKTHPHAALIVDASPMQWKLPDDAELLSFFYMDPAVGAELASYKPAATLDDCDAKRERSLEKSMCRFDIWRRNDVIPR